MKPETVQAGLEGQKRRQIGARDARYEARDARCEARGIKGRKGGNVRGKVSPIMSMSELPERHVPPRTSNGHGGLRPGAGRPHGSTVSSGVSKVYKPTAERAELLSLWRSEVSKQFEVLVQAQLSSAQGVTHMVARDNAGRWMTVTDPEVMVERLNAGHEAYRLTAVAPNATLIGQIMDRLFGQARQTIDLDVNTEPSKLSDAELMTSLSSLMKKLDTSAPTIDADVVVKSPSEASLHVESVNHEGERA